MFIDFICDGFLPFFNQNKRTTKITRFLTLLSTLKGKFFCRKWEKIFGNHLIIGTMGGQLKIIRSS